MEVLLDPFLRGRLSRSFLSKIEDHQVFGLGISFSKSDAEIKEVRLIVRDKYKMPQIRGLLKKKQDKLVFDFFEQYPREGENPDDGIHGNLAALKISYSGIEDLALYRRIGNKPICYACSNWSAYLYENEIKKNIPCFNNRKNLDLFKLERKVSGFGDQSLVTYPIYSAIKRNGSLKEGFDHIFGGQILKNEYFSVELRIKHFQALGLTPVAVGESGPEIKIYFVDFNGSFRRSL